jgi:hypothetical protein
MLNGRQGLVNRSLLRSVHGANLNPFADDRKCRPPMKKPRRCRRGFQVRVRRYYFAAAVSSPAGALLGALLLCELLCELLLLCELWCELLCELLLWVAGVVAAGAGSSAAKAGAANTARAMTGTRVLNIDVVSSENE